jgi:hypothetical protein
MFVAAGISVRLGSSGFGIRGCFWRGWGFAGYEFLGGISHILAIQAGVILINRFLACLAAFLAMFAVSALFIELNRNKRDKVVELAQRKL